MASASLKTCYSRAPYCAFEFDRFDKLCFVFLSHDAERDCLSREHDIHLKGNMSWGDDDSNTQMHTDTQVHPLRVARWFESTYARSPP